MEEIKDGVVTLKNLEYESRGSPEANEYLFVRESRDERGYIDYETIRINTGKGTVRKTKIVEGDPSKGKQGVIHQTGGDITLEELGAIISIFG